MNLDQANFFLAVCSTKPLLGAPAYFYIPQSANVLAEREQHIERLQSELHTKDQWLEAAKSDLAGLQQEHSKLLSELEAKNKWALEQNDRVAQAAAAVAKLDTELAAAHQAAQALAAQYEERLRSVEAESASHVAWAQQTEQRLSAEITVLANHIAKLDADLANAAAVIATYQKKLEETEATVIERTQWAQSLEAAKRVLELRLAGFEASRWTKVGRAFGLGPKQA